MAGNVSITVCKDKTYVQALYKDIALSYSELIEECIFIVNNYNRYLCNMDFPDVILLICVIGKSTGKIGFSGYKPKYFPKTEKYLSTKYSSYVDDIKMKNEGCIIAINDSERKAIDAQMSAVIDFDENYIMFDGGFYKYDRKTYERCYSPYEFSVKKREIHESYFNELKELYDYIKQSKNGILDPLVNEVFVPIEE